MKKNVDRPPLDVLFLQPVNCAGEKSRRGRLRVLYCDVEGRVFASEASRSMYEFSREIAGRAASQRSPFAAIGLETIPGRMLPVVININEADSRMLERISDHAARRGKLPCHLKKHIHRILNPVGVNFESVVPARRKHRRGVQPEITTRTLEKLPGYPEHEIYITMPLYKAAYRYPLIIMGRLWPDETTLPGTIRLLALDGEGDLVVIHTPEMLSAHQGNYKTNTNRNKCNVSVLLPETAQGDYLTRMSVTRHQRDSLETLADYYINTGSSKQPLSRTALSVIERARELASKSVLSNNLS